MKLNSLKTRLINSLSKKETQKLVFLHVPKCGGTSLDTAIRYQYFTLNVKRDNFVYGRVNALNSAYIGSITEDLNFKDGDPKNNRNMLFNRDYCAYKLLDKDLMYFSGHFPFDINIFNEFSNEYDYFTILRDPVQKWLSNFYYRGKRHSIIKGEKLKHWDVNMDIQNYLKTERGSFHGYDYAKYYGGIREDYMYNSKEAIENAKKNLNKFKVIGFLEDMVSVEEEFKKHYGFDLNISHRNKSRSKEDQKVSDDVLQQIKEICATDIEIYNYAKQLVKNRDA